jgi:hypothetical protein
VSGLLIACKGGWTRAFTRRRPPTPFFRQAMFIFFSNRLGCLGSIVVSLVLTVLVLLLFGWL